MKKIFCFIFSFFMLCVCAGADTGGYKKEVKSGDYTFVVSVNSKKVLKISAYQGSGRRPVIKKKNFEGAIAGCEAASMIKGNTQLLIYTASKGAGQYGGVVAYNFGPKKSIGIKMPALAGGNGEGYGGHDVFFVKDGRLVRKYPVYQKGDADCCPKGGERVIQYRLSLKNNPEFIEVK